mgnify:CR=1 FL=1
MNLSNLQQIDLKNPKSYTSFSRLESFKKCPEYYHLKYEERLKEEKALNKHLETGALVHSVLADYLENKTPLLDSFYLHLGLWLKKHNLDLIRDDQEELIESVEPASELLWRASEKCNDEDLLIRTESGNLLKNPIDYPSNKFKKLCNKAGITQKFGELDTLARSLNNEFVYTSFSWLVARSLYLVKYFTIPSWVSKIVAVELGISTEEKNRVDIPETTKPLLGYIDWIVELEDGQLLLIDHKTSKEKPSPFSVFLHPQLNAYSYLYEKIYGRQIDMIGINHLESGTYVVCSTNKEVINNNIMYYSDLQKQIDTGVHYRHSPLDYNSPCIKVDWKSKKITESCPFLSHCHPIFDKLKDNY